MKLTKIDCLESRKNFRDDYIIKDRNNGLGMCQNLT